RGAERFRRSDAGRGPVAAAGSRRFLAGPRRVGRRAPAVVVVAGPGPAGNHRAGAYRDDRVDASATDRARGAESDRSGASRAIAGGTARAAARAARAAAPDARANANECVESEGRRREAASRLTIVAKRARGRERAAERRR